MGQRISYVGTAGAVESTLELAELITSRRLNAFLPRPMVSWQLSLGDDNAIATSI